MSEMNIRNGDILTFTALQWREEENRGAVSPTILLTPVAHIYEDGFELETAINEALVDARVDGKLCDMTFERFLAERGMHLKRLKRIAYSMKKAKNKADEKYRILQETYQFWRDEQGKFQYVKLSH